MDLNKNRLIKISKKTIIIIIAIISLVYLYKCTFPKFDLPNSKNNDSSNEFPEIIMENFSLNNFKYDLDNKKLEMDLTSESAQKFKNRMEIQKGKINFYKTNTIENEIMYTISSDKISTNDINQLNSFELINNVHIFIPEENLNIYSDYATLITEKDSTYQVFRIEKNVKFNSTETSYENFKEINGSCEQLNVYIKNGIFEYLELKENANIINKDNQMNGDKIFIYNSKIKIQDGSIKYTTPENEDLYAKGDSITISQKTDYQNISVINGESSYKSNEYLISSKGNNLNYEIKESKNITYIYKEAYNFIESESNNLKTEFYSMEGTINKNDFITFQAEGSCKGIEYNRKYYFKSQKVNFNEKENTIIAKKNVYAIQYLPETSLKNITLKNIKQKNLSIYRTIKSEYFNAHIKDELLNLKESIEINDYNEKYKIQCELLKFIGKDTNIYEAEKNISLKSYLSIADLEQNKKVNQILTGEYGKVYSNQKRAFITGNAKLLDNKEELYIEAYQIEAYYNKNQYQFISNVHLISLKDDISVSAKGDFATYTDELIKINGNVVLHHNKDVIKANKIELNTQTREIKVQELIETKILSF